MSLRRATPDRFIVLCQKLIGSNARFNSNLAWKIYLKLLEAYTGSNRYYHDIKHIEEGLELLDKPEVRRLAHNPDILEMKWWWHDETYAVKGPEIKLNEAKSALSAFKALRELGVPDRICVEVMAGIMPTLHSYIPTEGDDILLVDIDLVRLAAPWEDFCLNAEKIRKEYKATTEEFKAGQTQFFANFMKNRPSVFLTKHFRERFELQAQSNIRRVLGKV